MRETDWSKYFTAFLITALVFFGAFYISNTLNKKRVKEVENIQNRISLDILSSETQFELLRDVPCKAITNSVLSEELNALASRMSYAEGLLGANNDEVVKLKETYFLLEVKDYLLAKKIDQECDTRPVLVLYFYSNTDCDDCQKAGFVLTRLREKYPDVRVYSFDYDYNSPIVKTLISIFGIRKELPAIVVDEEISYGFKKLEELEKIFPKIKKLPISENFSTSTPKN